MHANQKFFQGEKNANVLTVLALFQKRRKTYGFTLPKGSCIASLVYSRSSEKLGSRKYGTYLDDFAFTSQVLSISVLCRSAAASGLLVNSIIGIMC